MISSAIHQGDPTTTLPSPKSIKPESIDEEEDDPAVASMKSNFRALAQRLKSSRSESEFLASISPSAPSRKRNSSSSSSSEALLPLDHSSLILIDSPSSPDVERAKMADLLPGFSLVRAFLSGDEVVQWGDTCLNRYAVESNYNNITVNGGKMPMTARRGGEREGEELVVDACELRKRLTWCCLGYNYDWTTRKYRKGWKQPFPSDLAELAARVLKRTEEAREKADDDEEDEEKKMRMTTYTPEAAIVYFYTKPSSRMSLHRDDAELTYRFPIVSISLGASCLFCMESRHTGKLVAMILRSGDVCVMSGESREALHGVGGILLPDPSVDFSGPRKSIARTATTREEEEVREFLRLRRININVRQVEGDRPGEKFV